jgi:redox-regulated HSP33 family molecular chaperone
MKERILQVMADIDASRLIDLIDEDIEAIATLATDAEITRQFETIQKELEGILRSYLAEYIDAKLYRMVKDGELRYG